MKLTPAVIIFMWSQSESEIRDACDSIPWNELILDALALICTWMTHIPDHVYITAKWTTCWIIHQKKGRGERRDGGETLWWTVWKHEAAKRCSASVKIKPQCFQFSRSDTWTMSVSSQILVQPLLTCRTRDLFSFKHYHVSAARPLQSEESCESNEMKWTR